MKHNSHTAQLLAQADTSGLKQCSRCDRHKEPESFGRNATQADGLDYYCKSCRRIQRAEYFRSPRGQAKRRAEMKTDRYRAARRERKHRHRLRHPERVAAYQRTPLARLSGARAKLRRKLREEMDEGRREEILQEIRLCEVEMENIRRQA